MGTELLRGVSGGEKKRTQIGMELILAPRVLLLDEPTSGLDARTAANVIEILQQLCHGADRTVLMAIHQPRYSIFRQLDHVTLLSRGRIAYAGATASMLPFFASHGHE